LVILAGDVIKNAGIADQVTHMNQATDIRRPNRERSIMERRQFLGWLGAAAAVAVAPRSSARAAASGAIYQRIWDADQAASGIPAIMAGQAGDPARGFVRVDERGGRDRKHRLFAEVHIPQPKRRTYDLCEALFNNYRLDQTEGEDNRPEEAREILALLEAVADSAPMALARAHLEERHGRSYAGDAWQELLYEVWFRQFDDGRNRALSGFEHVAVGEQKGGKVNGHHFWYKYWLDDWAAFSGQDDIDYDGGRYDGPRRSDGRLAAFGRRMPEVVTLAYSWDAYDAETGERRALYQPIGGFWVGCSIEGLLALGTVRFFGREQIETTINGARYQVELYRSPDGRSVRTFFPRFLGLA
jgi:hypothetical protein